MAFDPLAGLLGGGGAPPAPAPGGDMGMSPEGGAGGQPGAPDSPQVEALLQTAIDSLDQAVKIEGDPQDKALLAELSAKLLKFVGDQQGLVDKAMGAGPGVKIMRKASGGGGAGY